VRCQPAGGARAACGLVHACSASICRPTRSALVGYICGLRARVSSLSRAPVRPCVRGARRRGEPLHGSLALEWAESRACARGQTARAAALSPGARRAQGSVGEVERFLEGQGLNARALVDGAARARGAAGDALTTARPTLDSTVSTLRATDPVVLAQWAGIAAGVYYLARAPNPNPPPRELDAPSLPGEASRVHAGCAQSRRSPQHARSLRAALPAAHRQSIWCPSVRSPCLPANDRSM